jgi:hypothetical protein
MQDAQGTFSQIENSIDVVTTRVEEVSHSIKELNLLRSTLLFDPGSCLAHDVS